MTRPIVIDSPTPKVSQVTNQEAEVDSGLEDDASPVNNSFKLTYSLELTGGSKHSQYVDVCEWSPTKDILLTASSDKKCLLWTSFGSAEETSDNSASAQPVPLDENVCCAAWDSSGSRLALGKSTHSSSKIQRHPWKSKDIHRNQWKSKETRGNPQRSTEFKRNP